MVCLSVVSQQYGPLFPHPPGTALSRWPAVSLQISSVLEASRWQSWWLACAAAKSPSPKLQRFTSRSSPSAKRFASMCVQLRPSHPANRTRLCHAAPRIWARAVMGQPIDRLYALRSKRQFRRRHRLLLRVFHPPSMTSSKASPSLANPSWFVTSGDDVPFSTSRDKRETLKEVVGHLIMDSRDTNSHVQYCGTEFSQSERDGYVRGPSASLPTSPVSGTCCRNNRTNRQAASPPPDIQRHLTSVDHTGFPLLLHLLRVQLATILRPSKYLSLQSETGTRLHHMTRQQSVEVA